MFVPMQSCQPRRSHVFVESVKSGVYWQLGANETPFSRRQGSARLTATSLPLGTAGSPCSITLGWRQRGCRKHTFIHVFLHPVLPAVPLSIKRRGSHRPDWPRTNKASFLANVCGRTTTEQPACRSHARLHACLSHYSGLPNTSSLFAFAWMTSSLHNAAFSPPRHFSHRPASYISSMPSLVRSSLPSSFSVFS